MSDCGCESPAIVRDDGTCSGCGAQVVPAAPQQPSPEETERATVPASEYDALADAFRDFIADATMTPASEVGVMELGEHLHGLADDEYAFLARALKQGSRALATRREPEVYAASQHPPLQLDAEQREQCRRIAEEFERWAGELRTSHGLAIEHRAHARFLRALADQQPSEEGGRYRLALEKIVAPPHGPPVVSDWRRQFELVRNIALAALAGSDKKPEDDCDDDRAREEITATLTRAQGLALLGRPIANALQHAFHGRERIREALLSGKKPAHGEGQTTPFPLDGLSEWLENQIASTKRIMADVDPDSMDRIRLKGILDAYGYVAERFTATTTQPPPEPTEKAVGWDLIHDAAAGGEQKVDVCLGEGTHVWGFPTGLNNVSFVLIDPTPQHRWRHEVAWKAVKAARPVEAPADVIGTCAICSPRDLLAASSQKPCPRANRDEGRAVMAEAAKDFWAERRARTEANYLASVERGEHDEKCEFDVRGYYLCHCSKRRRQAAGFTKPPDEDLYFPPPNCPHCDEGLDHDDGWVCVNCSLRWDSNGCGDSARFMDDFGSDLTADVERWRRINLATQPDVQVDEGAG